MTDFFQSIILNYSTTLLHFLTLMVMIETRKTHLGLEVIFFSPKWESEILPLSWENHLNGPFTNPKVMQYLRRKRCSTDVFRLRNWVFLFGNNYYFLIIINCWSRAENWPCKDGLSPKSSRGPCHSTIYVCWERQEGCQVPMFQISHWGWFLSHWGWFNYKKKKIMEENWINFWMKTLILMSIGKAWTIVALERSKPLDFWTSWIVVDLRQTFIFWDGLGHMRYNPRYVEDIQWQ